MVMVEVIVEVGSGDGGGLWRCEGELFDTLMSLRDDRRNENDRLLGFNALISVPIQRSTDVPTNAVARRVVDDLMEFTGETSVTKYMRFFNAQQIVERRRFVNCMRDEVQTCRTLIGQLNALIAELEAMEDQGELFDTLMSLRDDRRNENDRLLGFNAKIAKALEEIEIKEAHVEAADNSD
ncbi:hypothetical protein Tco_1323665 [Tanacetum coccineum]